MRLRILHVTAGIDPAFGGVTQAVQTMIKGLSNHDINNEVVCLDDPNATFLTASFPIYALGPAKGPWCYSPKLLPWLRKHLYRYDAVIVHGLWLYHAYATKTAIRKERKKNRTSKEILSNSRMFVMPHGMLDPYFQKAEGRKLKAIRNFIYWKIFENRVVNNADALFFTCDEELRLAHQSFHPFIPKKEIVVGLGVDAPPAYSTPMTKAFLNFCPEILGRPYFLFLSRVHEKKGVDILIKAYRQILNKVTKEEIEMPALVIAGPGLDSDFGKEMIQIASEDEKLRGSVFFPGMLTGDAKWGAFYGCEVFVLPSHQENFGIAVAESLACSKPVLISNKINIWKDIETNAAGIVAQDSIRGTIELFERWLMSTKDEKEEMGRRARDIYESKFAIELVVKRLAEVLH